MKVWLFPINSFVLWDHELKKNMQILYKCTPSDYGCHNADAQKR